MSIIKGNRDFLKSEPGNNRCIQQFVEDVFDYSSQYGSGGSISYTAHNIVGKPRIFPQYGDFPQAFIMRTYGEWWDHAPSGTREISPQNIGEIRSQDYIDLMFEEPVYPTSVAIYETYNPGAIVRIWACEGRGRWTVLWQAPPSVVQPTSRIFSPEIKPTSFPTNMLRLEFDHRHLEYYTELDAVLLTGTVEPPPACEGPQLGAGEITRRVISLNLHCLPAPSAVPIVEETLPPNNNFDLLPHETVLQVLQHLDLLSLCRCAQVSKRFRDIATDPSLYVEVNLRPYWPLVTSACLQSLTPRCKRLKALDLSWCRGGELQPFTDAFVRFILNCGSSLRILRLRNCKFINNECLEAISQTCLTLEELSLRNVMAPTREGWSSLGSLTSLKHLDLFHTPLDIGSILHILQHTSRLQHLNLGSCILNPSMDQVAETLAAHCPALKSVDMWKTYSLSTAGLRSLAACRNLQELELGWCGELDAPGDSLQEVALRCPDLRKLFVAAVRGISDRDVLVFVQHCPRLEQVDLLGARNVSPEACLRLLTQCPHLCLLDLSFCEQILEGHVRQWRTLFPHVSIKRSFTPEADS